MIYTKKAQKVLLFFYLLFSAHTATIASASSTSLSGMKNTIMTISTFLLSHGCITEKEEIPENLIKDIESDNPTLENKISFKSHLDNYYTSLQKIEEKCKGSEWESDNVMSQSHRIAIQGICKEKFKPEFYLNLIDKFLKDNLAEKYLEKIAKLPDDVIQQGKDHLADYGDQYKDFEGLAPALRKTLCEIKKEQILKYDKNDLEAYKAQLAYQLNQESAQDKDDKELERLSSHLKELKFDDDKKLDQDKQSLIDITTEFTKKDGRYCTETDAGLLATYFGIKFNVQGKAPTHDGNDPFPLPFAFEIVHNGKTGVGAHFSYPNAHTLSGGNCLLNAFSQYIAHIYVKEILRNPEGRTAQQQALLKIMDTPEIVNPLSNETQSPDINSKKNYDEIDEILSLQAEITHQNGQEVKRIKQSISFKLTNFKPSEASTIEELKDQKNKLEKINIHTVALPNQQAKLGSIKKGKIFDINKLISEKEAEQKASPKHSKPSMGKTIYQYSHHTAQLANTSPVEAPSSNTQDINSNSTLTIKHPLPTTPEPGASGTSNDEHTANNSSDEKNEADTNTSKGIGIGKVIDIMENNINNPHSAFSGIGSNSNNSNEEGLLHPEQCDASLHETLSLSKHDTLNDADLTKKSDQKKSKKQKSTTSTKEEQDSNDQDPGESQSEIDFNMSGGDIDSEDSDNEEDNTDHNNQPTTIGNNEKNDNISNQEHDNHHNKPISRPISLTPAGGTSYVRGGKDEYSTDEEAHSFHFNDLLNTNTTNQVSKPSIPYQDLDKEQPIIASTINLKTKQPSNQKQDELEHQNTLSLINDLDSEKPSSSLPTTIPPSIQDLPSNPNKSTHTNQHNNLYTQDQYNRDAQMANNDQLEQVIQTSQKTNEQQKQLQTMTPQHLQAQQQHEQDQDRRLQNEANDNDLQKAPPKSIKPSMEKTMCQNTAQLANPSPVEDDLKNLYLMCMNAGCYGKYRPRVYKYYLEDIIIEEAERKRKEDKKEEEPKCECCGDPLEKLTRIDAAKAKYRHTEDRCRYKKLYFEELKDTGCPVCKCLKDEEDKKKKEPIEKV